MQKTRLRPTDLPVHAHARILKQWLARSPSTQCGSKDIVAALQTMAGWSRSLPLPEEILQYADLVQLYAAEEPSLCYVGAGLARALHELDEGGIIELAAPKHLSAKTCSGIIRGGLSKYREIATQQDKQRAIFARCTAYQSAVLAHLTSPLKKKGQQIAPILDWALLAHPETPPHKTPSQFAIQNFSSLVSTPPTLDWSSLISSPLVIRTLETTDDLNIEDTLALASATPLPTGRGALTLHLPKAPRTTKNRSKRNVAQKSTKPIVKKAAAPKRKVAKNATTPIVKKAATPKRKVAQKATKAPPKRNVKQQKVTDNADTRKNVSRAYHQAESQASRSDLFSCKTKNKKYYIFPQCIHCCCKLVLGSFCKQVGI